MARSICCQKIWSVSVTAQFPRSGHLPYESSLLGLKPWSASFAKSRFAVCMSASSAFWPLKANRSIPGCKGVAIVSSPRPRFLFESCTRSTAAGDFATPSRQATLSGRDLAAISVGITSTTPDEIRTVIGSSGLGPGRETSLSGGTYIGCLSFPVMDCLNGNVYKNHEAFVDSQDNERPRSDQVCYGPRC